MTDGRLQGQIKYENKTLKMISKQPEAEILTQYYDSLSDLQGASRFQFCSKVAQYFKYLRAQKEIDQITYDDLGHVSVLDIKKYIADRSRIATVGKDGREIIRAASSSTVAAHLSALSSFFSFLRLVDVVSDNPCDLVKKPKIENKKEYHWLNKEEISALMLTMKKAIKAKERFAEKAIAIRNYALVSVFLTTGVRATALSEVTLDKLDLESKTLIVTDKGNKGMTYYLPDNVIEAINMWLDTREQVLRGKKNDYLFIGRRNDHITYGDMLKSIKEISEISGKQITCHELRHTFGTLLYVETKDPMLVKTMLNHSSWTTTSRYMNAVNNEEKKKAAGIAASFVGLTG